MKDIINKTEPRSSMYKLFWGSTILTLVVMASFLLFSKATPALAACAPTTSFGTDTITMSVPATGTYTAWIRLLSPDGTNNQAMMAVDGGTCTTFGKAMAANTWTWVDTPSGSTTPVTMPLTAGSHTVVLTGNQAGVGVDRIIFTQDTTCTPTGTGDNCTPPLAVTTPYYLNVGGSAFTDPQSHLWQTDQYFTMDNTFGATGPATVGGDGTACTTAAANENCTSHAITGTTNPQLYQTERWGAFHYDIPVNNGNYTVILNFAEINPNAGTRVFNVSLNGTQVLTNFNIAGEVGNYTVDDKTFPVTVSNNDLNVTLTAITQAPKLNGIEILPQAPPSVSISAPASGATVSGSAVTLSAAASDAIAVSQVQFKVDGTVVATDTTSPYTTNWNSTSVADGTHTITAIATNSAGLTATAQETITVANNLCSGTPTVPSNLSDTDTAPLPANKVDLGFTPGAAAANCVLAGTNIYRNGTKVNTSPVVGGSYSDTTVAANTTYTYQITSIDTAGHESAKIPATPLSVTTGLNCTTGSGAPTTPILTAVPNPSSPYTQVFLSWTASTVNNGCTLTGYHIYRDGGTTPVITGPATSAVDFGINLTPPNLNSGTTYHYTIQAYDSGGNNSSSSSATVTTKSDDVAPTMPTGLTGTAPNSSSVSLNWSASTDLPNPGAVGLKGYFIYRNDSATPLNASPVASVSFTDSTVAASTTYKYAVAAVDNNNNISSLTADISVTTPAAPPTCTGNPTTPGNFASTGQTMTTISLSWSASTPAANCTISGYQVFRNHSIINTISGTTFNDSGLAGNTSYVYDLIAVDTNGHPSPSTTDLTVKTTGDLTPPSNPTNFTVSSPSSSQVSLGWTASTDNVAVTGYNLYRNSFTTPYQVLPATATSFSDTNVTGSTTYTYKLQAFDGANNVSAQVASTPATITTPAPTCSGNPSTPTGLAQDAVTSSSAAFHWTASTPAANCTISGYNIFRNGSTTPVNTSLVTSTSFTDSGLTASTTYSYTVVAVDSSAHKSLNSGALSITTSPATVVLQADVNHDGHVNFNDLAAFVQDYQTFNGKTVTAGTNGDLDNNGLVNFNDLSIFAFYYPIQNGL